MKRMIAKICLLVFVLCFAVSCKSNDDDLFESAAALNSVEAGGVPCRYSCLLNEDVLAEHPHYEEICNALEAGQYRPIMSNWNEFSEVLGGYMREIMEGTYDVPTGLAAAQEELMNLSTKE